VPGLSEITAALGRAAVDALRMPPITVR